MNSPHKRKLTLFETECGVFMPKCILKNNGACGSNQLEDTSSSMRAES